MLPLPPAPTSWQSAEQMKYWLLARAEEDRRFQEVERTCQETLRLKQREIEQSMLQDSLRAGVPPHIIPLIFAGMKEGKNSQVVDLFEKHTAQETQSAPPSVPPQHVPHGRAQFTLPNLDAGNSTLRLPPLNTHLPQQAQDTLDSRADNRPVPAEKNSPNLEEDFSSMSRTPGPHASQSTPVQHQPLPQRAQPSIGVLQWLPPQSPSQPPGPYNRVQTETFLQSDSSEPTTPSQPKSESNPSRKRKSQSTHQQLPPPMRPQDVLGQIPRRGSSSSIKDLHPSGMHEQHKQCGDLTGSNEPQDVVESSSQVEESAAISKVATHSKAESGMSILKLINGTLTELSAMKKNVGNSRRESHSQPSARSRAAKGFECASASPLPTSHGPETGNPENSSS